MTDRTSLQTRILTFDVDGRDTSSDAIPVVISSDAVVEVEDGPEILVHSREAVDLTRAPLPIIATHRGGQVNVGIIDGIEIANGKMRGLARFGSRPEAAGYRDDVLNKIIRSVSAGYRRVRSTIRNDGVLVTSRWMPTHAAMVAEPADVNAGFFREQPFVIETEAAVAAEAIPAAVAATPAPVARGAIMSEAPKAAAPVVTEPELQAQNPMAYEQARKQAIINLVRANKLDERIGNAWISQGASMEQVSKDILDILEERGRSNPAASPTHIGIENKEVRKYSVLRALRAAASGDWNEAGLEREASQEVAKRIGRPAGKQGFFVPMDIQQRDLAQRDLTVASSSGGGYLKATDNMSFIEILRNRMVCRAMGARVMSGLVGNVTIPKQTGAATGYWLTDETTAITESQQTFGQLALTPRTVGALTQVSRLLMLQSSPSAEQIVLSDLAAVVAIAVDLAGLAGTGTEQPTGIINTSSIGGFTGTSLAAAGLLDAQADVASANALSGSLGYVTTPTVAGLLMARPELPTSGTTRMWQGNMQEGSIFGFRAMTSAQMPAGDMIFGDWSQLVIGEWGVLELATSESANTADFHKGITTIRAFYSVDVGVRYAGAFSLATSIT